MNSKCLWTFMLEMKNYTVMLNVLNIHTYVNWYYVTVVFYRGHFTVRVSDNVSLVSVKQRCTGWRKELNFLKMTRLLFSLFCEKTGIPWIWPFLLFYLCLFRSVLYVKLSSYLGPLYSCVSSFWYTVQGTPVVLVEVLLW